MQFDTADNAETAICTFDYILPFVAMTILLTPISAKFTGYQYGGRPLGLTYVKYQNPNGSESHGRTRRHGWFDSGSDHVRLGPLTQPILPSRQMIVRPDDTKVFTSARLLLIFTTCRGSASGLSLSFYNTITHICRAGSKLRRSHSGSKRFACIITLSFFLSEVFGLQLACLFHW